MTNNRLVSKLGQDNLLKRYFYEDCRTERKTRCVDRQTIGYLGKICKGNAFVSSSERGQGIGKQLIHYGIKNFAINEVTVNEQNPKAIGFYNHMGFQVYKRTAEDEQGNPYRLYTGIRLNKDLRNFMYSLLLAVIYLAFISLGLPDSLLGSGWPAMQQDFDVPISYVGFVSMVISCGTICSSLLSERLTKKFGTSIVTSFSVFLTAIALFGFSMTNSFWMLCIWAIPYGLGAGAIDAALNNYVAIHYSSRHMSWLHCFWGVGSIISPYIMSFALAHSTWENGYRSVSFIQVGIAILLVCTLHLWKINRKSEGQDRNMAVIGIKGVLKMQGVPYLLIGFFCNCTVESTVMLWASSYLAVTRNFTEERAAAYASLFFIGMTVGRFISGLLPDEFSDRRRIQIGTGVALAGMICLPLSAAGLFIIGLGFAPIYPSIIHSTPYNFGADNSQAIIGIQMASAYIGSTFMPPLFGIIAKNVTLKLMPFFWLYSHCS